MIVQPWIIHCIIILLWQREIFTLILLKVLATVKSHLLIKKIFFLREKWRKKQARQPRNQQIKIALPVQLKFQAYSFLTEHPGNFMLQCMHRSVRNKRLSVEQCRNPWRTHYGRHAIGSRHPTFYFILLRIAIFWYPDSLMTYTLIPG